MQTYTIIPMVVGANETDQGVMTYLRDYGKRIWIPIYVFIIKGGDRNILDGIDVILTPGHSPGGQSVSVNTEKGRAVITGFCCNGKNFPKTGPAVAPGVHLDLVEAYDSIQRIKNMDATIIPIHDLGIGSRKSIP